MKDGYSICFNEWALDKEIKNELGLLLIISSLCAEKGFCYANNEFFSNIFNIDAVSVSRKIKKLESKRYINIEYETRGTQIKSRKIRLTKMSMDHIQNCYWTINKNVKDNNTSINIKENISKDILKKVFKKPTLEEIKEYIIDADLKYIDPEDFIDFYESKGWKVGKEPMKDWKACARRWNRSNYPKVKYQETENL